MVNVTTTESHFIFEMKGWHKFWTFRDKISVLKKNVLKAYQDDSEFTFWKGIRCPGIEFPGLITAGSYYKKGWDFWDVRHKRNAIVVTLENSEFKKLIIEVQNPKQTLQLLNSKS